MTTRLRRLLAAATATVALLTLSGCTLGLQGLPKPGGLSGASYLLHARFDDVLNLPANAQVRDGARVVGQVSSMRVDGYSAQLTLRILDGYRVPAGTTAQVRFDNPLGDQYIELDRPRTQTTGPYLRAGDTLRNTSAAPTVEATLGAFATVLTGGGVGDIGTIIRELNDIFDGNQQQIRQLVHRLDLTVTDLAHGLGPINRTLTQMAALARTYNVGRDTLTHGIATLSPALKVLADQNDQFTALLQGLDRFAKAGNRVVGASGAQTVAAVKALVPVVRQIVAARDRISPVLANVRTLLAQVPHATKDGYLLVSMKAALHLDSGPDVAGPAASAASAHTVDSLMTAVGPLHTGGAR